MGNIHYFRRFTIANRRGTLKFEMPKVEAVAACYSETLEALVFRLAFIKAEKILFRAEQGA